MYALEGGMPSRLAGGQDITFEEAAYELGPGGQGDFESPVLRLGYSSLATPHSTIDYNMATGKRCGPVPACWATTRRRSMPPHAGHQLLPAPAQPSWEDCSP